MLRSLRSRKNVAQPFVCFQCLARSSYSSPSNASRIPLARPLSQASGDGSTKGVRRQFHAGGVARSALETIRDTPLPQEPPPLSSSQPDIRERLRQWEIDNSNPLIPPDIPGAVPEPGVAHNLTLSSSTFENFAEDLREPKAAYDDKPFGLDTETFEMIDVGDARNFLLPGDLVELVTVGYRRQELAIYVRELNKQGQFYTMSGRWLQRVAGGICFFVPAFVNSKELDTIRPFLPEEEVDFSMEGKLQSFNDSVPVDIGQPLISKMMNFWNKADATYQYSAMKLDDAHQAVADIFHYKYASLEEIADKVLPKQLARMKNGKWSWPVLYAVHRALLKNDIGFLALPSETAMRMNTQYEINGFSEVDSIRRVVRWVREYSDSLLGPGKTSLRKSHSEFMDFVKRAQQLIDLSRANRQLTSHGTIGPSLINSGPDENFRAGTSRGIAFTAEDMLFIRFLESWTCLISFNSSSQLHGVGATILRTIDRYQGQDLRQDVAWMCLQELGALPPWEIRASFALRLPYAGRQEAIQHRLHPPTNLKGGVVKDKMSSVRKNWGPMPVYCVDDAGALEIDDGFSLEATDEPGVYWVHVHIADPAAHLDPRGLLSQFAERVAETVYLPDRVVTMLPAAYTQAHFSLAPNRPCLTFSAKTNLQGELLDSKITSGIIENVKYLTNKTYQEVAGGKANAREYDIYVVGNPKARADSRTVRHLSTSDQFSEEDRENMKILQAIGAGRRKLLEARGGISGGAITPEVSMSFNGYPWTKPKNTTDSLQYFGDPTITLAIERTVDGTTLTQNIDTVGSIMIMAGEVAAKWCAERGIPIPYRVTPFNPDKQNPSEYFQQVMQCATRDENGNLPAEVAYQYFNLIGKVQPSSVPGPHVALGLEAFAKVTSPLRRFGDLVSHWQIQAALLEELRTGKSIVGQKDLDFLPFTQAQVDELLPRMATRERKITHSSTAALRAAHLQLVLRAWKFGECKLPENLEFITRSIDPRTGLLGGLLPKLLLGGQMRVPKGMDITTVEEGDRFEVEIEDINIYQRRAFFKFVRRWESATALEGAGLKTT